MNVVMTGKGGFVEVQGTAEGAPFSAKQMESMLQLAQRRDPVAGGRAEARSRIVTGGALSWPPPTLRSCAKSRRYWMDRPGTSCRRATWGSIRPTSPTQRSSRTRLPRRVMPPLRTGTASARRRLGTVCGVAERRTRRAVGALCGLRRDRSEQQRGTAAAAVRRCQRRAHYTCVLVALRSAEDAEPIIVDAHWHGEIAQAPRGSGGFGYDPLF